MSLLTYLQTFADTKVALYLWAKNDHSSIKTASVVLKK